MKFAHLSDVHIGSWKDPRMRSASTLAFLRAMDLCVEQLTDFILISGDLFDTALPAVDLLKDVTAKLREVHSKGIPVYIIAGSHDFSPSGKTMLDVLESAGLVVNVARADEVEGKLSLRWTIDAKTGVKITGIIGKKGMLDSHYYEHLLRTPLESEPGYKIFLFHTAISEFKPKDLEQMDAHPLSLLPRNFDYYAGGHVHYIEEFSRPGYNKIVYPGALFPCNFAELQKYSHGYLHIIENNDVKKIPVQLFECTHLNLDCKNLTPTQISSLIRKELPLLVQQHIITIRLQGRIRDGYKRDVDFAAIFEELYAKGAHFVMKNTVKLLDDSYDELQIEVRDTHSVEGELIAELASKPSLTRTLMHTLSNPKQEGETIATFEDRLLSSSDLILETKDI